MEHIKKALERAQAQRVQSAGAALAAAGATARTAASPDPMPDTTSGAASSPAFRSPHPGAPTAASGDRPVAQTAVRPVDAEQIRTRRILAPAATGSAARAYKLLRTQVLQRMKREGLRSLAVVSANAGDGRTTAAVNLGITIGEDADHTALVVDLDLRRPGVAGAFGISAPQGVERCLRGESEVGPMLVAPKGYRGLTLLPASGAVAQSSELIASATARAVIAEVVDRYANRIVLFDVPPLLETDDTLALLPAVDAALLVVHEGRTPREDVERALALLGRTPVIGTVLNASREQAATD